jgi:hypothetical protein
LAAADLAVRLELIVAHTTYGPAQIPGLGIVGQFCHDLCERHAAGFVTQRLHRARGLAQRRGK